MSAPGGLSTLPWPHGVLGVRFSPPLRVAGDTGDTQRSQGCRAQRLTPALCFQVSKLEELAACSFIFFFSSSPSSSTQVIQFIVEKLGKIQTQKLKPSDRLESCFCSELERRQQDRQLGPRSPRASADAEVWGGASLWIWECEEASESQGVPETLSCYILKQRF